MSVWPIICGQDYVLCTFVNETYMWMWMNICVVRICLLWAFPITVTVSRSISSYFARIYPFSIYRNLPAIIRFWLSRLPIPTEQKIMRVKTVRGFFRPLPAVFTLSQSNIYGLNVCVATCAACIIILFRLRHIRIEYFFQSTYSHCHYCMHIGICSVFLEEPRARLLEQNFALSFSVVTR
jgi:hypothetical protein